MHVLGSCVVKLLSGAVSKLKRSCGESGGGVGCVSDSRIECFLACTLASRCRRNHRNTTFYCRLDGVGVHGLTISESRIWQSYLRRLAKQHLANLKHKHTHNYLATSQPLHFVCIRVSSSPDIYSSHDIMDASLSLPSITQHHASLNLPISLPNPTLRHHQQTITTPFCRPGLDLDVLSRSNPQKPARP